MWIYIHEQTEKKREKTQITKIRNENEDITTYFTVIKITIREYYKPLHDKKLDLDEMCKFPEIQISNTDSRRNRKSW